ncbi:protein of unknown function [Micromonospora haikouensis]|uniref:Carbohydrate-binding domain-containing protein n=1 Tax=Micromonospora haikouensis TaxID=686309 RepID=A0A1C4XQL4_9ACTN|nr:carbohydrate-binding domain-containing protein [Micromonospora haikouensis]SCF10714.1 protein of unknown function [Micromonospora haikouensis]
MRVLRKKLVAAVASVVLTAGLLSGCADGNGSTASPAASTTPAAVAVDGTQTADQVLAANTADHAAADAVDYDESSVVEIILDGTSASADGDGVKVDGATVTITAGGTYRISGTLTDGQVVVATPDATVRIILDGAAITSSGSAAIAVTEAEQAIVILADGSRNTLTDTSSYASDADVNAALFSAADLTVTGGGALTVRGAGNDGIASKDGLVIAAGTITVEAVDDGIRGKDYVVVDGGTITVNAGGDGVKADNTTDADAGYVAVTAGAVTVTAKGDGIDAATDLVVTGGTLAVTSGGGSGTRPDEETSAKGLKAGVIAVLEGGTVSVDASDDALHSDGSVRLGGASVTLASGDDAAHAENALVIDGGTVEVTASVEGLEAADIVLNGGDVHVVASDDGLNAAGGSSGQQVGAGGQQGGGPGGGGEAVGDYSVTITGGTLVVDSGGDGLDSNGTVTMTGGTVVVNGPTADNNGALDANGTFTVSGGVLVAAGSAGMAVAPNSDSTQGWVSVTLDSAVESGTTLHLVDSDGTVIATFVTSRTVQNIVFSSSAITSGEEYTLRSGGTATGGSIGGLAESGEPGSASTIATATAGEAPAGRGPGGGAPGGGGPQGGGPSGGN